MSVTIKINGLSLEHKGSGGSAKATLPNICKTPSPGGPVPVNYGNYALAADLAKGTTQVKADGGNSCAIQGSEFSKSTMDEPGTLGGIISGTNMAEATWLTFSFDVMFEGKGAARRTDKMMMNHMNSACLSGAKNPKVKSLDEQLKDLLCEAFCEVLKEREKMIKDRKAGKNVPRQDWSAKVADKLKDPKYAGRLDGLAKKMGGKIVSEKTMKLIVQKATKTGTRALVKYDALRNKILKELGGEAATKFAKKKVGKVFLKFVPGVNVVMGVYDAYDAVKTGYEVFQQLDEIMKKYKVVEMRPDVALMGKDGELRNSWDFKFPKDRSRGNQKAIMEEGALDGKKQQAIDDKNCKCPDMERGPRKGLKHR
ncbi:DUF4150 domain-containing protein [Acanthopleuribacter pedis]|uniref:DUF4150 domain-containing protein n=1 Tax=Acanthopleuribacter pedis TaxID=442870 RepID=A0A8J7QQI1_9BACT|nr:DUF4150 domain-containing protein [Acanthopleuribacter pedis]MBO1322315.1 DUF4150 domain-containing protein [Acanthopleuribacter pedis]